MPRFLRLLCSGAFLIAGFIPTATGSQDANLKDLRLLGTLEDTLINWFEQLSQSADHIADKEDQRKLKQSLIHLQKSLYALESNGRELLTILETKPLDEQRARTAVSMTRASLTLLQKDLHASGLNLRNQYRAGGAKAEEQITDAVSKRALWLSDLDGEIANHQISTETIAAGRTRVQSQRTAGMVLGVVIEKLPQ
jgi:hypothetical protein